MPRPKLEDKNYEIVMKLFDRRCIICNSTWGVTVHEITPKSLAPKTWMSIDNRVVLCNNCHEKIHNLSRKDRDDLLLPARERALKFRLS